MPVVKAQTLAERWLAVSGYVPDSTMPPRRHVTHGEPRNDACPWHQGRCAYDPTDPARCPWCHASWVVILRKGWHSCEHGDVWQGRDPRYRTAQARRWREQAAATTAEGEGT